MTSRTFFPIVVATGITLALAGCSFSKSSESSSTSSKSPFTLASSGLESSSDSSRTQEEKYERDVSDYTAEFVKSSKGDLATFNARLSELAKSHGITDWEADDATYVAIGKGMRKADLGTPQFEAFKQSMGAGDPRKAQAIERGYKD